MTNPLFDLTPFHRAPVEPAAGSRVLEELETCLASAVAAVGVAHRAVELLHPRWAGQQPTIPKLGNSDFLRDVGFCVALAALERGFLPAEAFSLWGVACSALQLHYGPAQLYIPVLGSKEDRYMKIMADIREFGLVETSKRWRCSYQGIRQLWQRKQKARRRVALAS